MSSEIRIEIPGTDPGNAELIPYFQDRISRLADAMDCDVAGFDERAQIDEVCVRNVEVHREGVAVTYELRFSAYYGCSEVDYSRHHQRILSGRREGDCWIFEPHRPSPSRSTLDEF